MLAVKVAYYAATSHARAHLEAITTEARSLSRQDKDVLALCGGVAAIAVTAGWIVLAGTKIGRKTA